MLKFRTPDGAGCAGYVRGIAILGYNLSMITMDDREIKKYRRDLKTFGARAYPYATRQTVNASAFKAQEIARGNIRNDMVTRNRFTEQSVRVNKARTLSIPRQEATVGSIADYLETQEFGGVERSNRGRSVAIATGYSAGQEGQQPRTRLPRKPNRMQAIQLQKRRKKGKNRKQQNLIAVKEAVKSGRKFAYMDLGRRRGIFRVLGGKRKPRVKMVHDLSRRSVAIPKRPWLRPAVQEARRHTPGIYRDALLFQLKRNRIFR